MNTVSKLYLHTAVALFAVATASAQVTAVNHGDHEWSGAEWTAGVPVAGGTAFLNDNTSINISDGTAATAQGIRIGNVTSSVAMLSLLEGSIVAHYIVVGNSVTSNGSYYQDGGALTINDSQNIDFMLGSNEGASTSPCVANATFSGGSASLADIVFNLSPNRSLSFTVDGSRSHISAKSLVAMPQAPTCKPATLDFKFDRRGVSTLKLSSFAQIGAGDRIKLKIDGSDYMGNQDRFILIETPSLEGEFVDIELVGFNGGASVYAEDNNIVLVIK
jgi:hypothetical protein